MHSPDFTEFVDKHIWVLVTGGLVSGLLREVTGTHLIFDPGYTIATGATFRNDLGGQAKVVIANVVAMGEGLITN